MLSASLLFDSTSIAVLMSKMFQHLLQNLNVGGLTASHLLHLVGLFFFLLFVGILFVIFEILFDNHFRKRLHITCI